MTDEFSDLLKQFEGNEENSTAAEPEKLPILLIDDDESIRRALSRALSGKYDVLTAESGMKGVELLSKEIHCVILDVKMRDMNGFAAYPKLKEKFPEVLIIFYTAFQSEHDLQDVINKFKPEGYVQKGKDISFLENLLENAVRKHQLIAENEAYRKDLEKKVAERTAQLKEQRDEAHNQKERAENLLLELKEAQSQIIELKTRKRQDKFLRTSAHEIKNKVNPISDYGKVIKRYTDFMPRLLEILNALIQNFIENADNPLTEDLLETKFLPLINEADLFFEQNDPERAIKAMTGLERALENTFKRLEIIRDEAKRRDPNAGYVPGNSRVRLDELIAAIKKDYGERIHNHGIRFDQTGDLQACLKGDRQHFYDILSNIVDNGLRHIVRASKKDPEAEKAFRIEVDGSGSQLRIRLTDTGTGMNEAESKGRIFDPFYTTNVGPEGEEIGWGTGLGIVRDYVELYRGKIDVEHSEPGKGTTFVVFLPKADDENSRGMK
jgi:signal transduction histidine kinase